MKQQKNALKTQIWIVISVYVLVAIRQKTAGLGSQPVRNSADSEQDIFEKMPILECFFGIGLEGSESSGSFQSRKRERS